MSVKFQLEKKQNINIFYLEGEIIEKTQAKELIEKIDELIALKENKIIFNLKALKYINSTGLSVIISLFTKCRNSSGELILTEESPKVKELFVITKLNSIFTVKETTEEALAYFASDKNLKNSELKK